MQIARQALSVFLVWLVLATSFVLPGFAQDDDGGLPGPVLQNGLQTLQKIETICFKCEEAESSYHAQVDVYNAARAAYEAKLVETRAAADAFLAARSKYVELNGEFEALNDAQHEWLMSDRPLDSDYFRLRDDTNFAEDDALAAQAVLAEHRAKLNAELRRLETVRQNALAEMRRANRLQSAMHQCELACEVSELDLDEPDLISVPPVGGGVAPQIPTPENFIGVVAKCMACQPLADSVNSIRSKRRSYAVDATTTADSLAANRQTLERLRAEGAALEAEQRDQFRDLFEHFAPQRSEGEQSFVDEVFDRQERDEFDVQLFTMTQKRADNAEATAGFERLIAQLEEGLQAALAGYQAQSTLLDAAQKALDECEATCATDEREPIDDPFTDPDYPQQENVDPILAECAKCQPIADQLVQVLSERRSVAGDIQTAVWLLKSRRDSLAKWEAQDDALEKEERDMGQLLIWGEEKGVNEAEVMRQLFEIEDKRTKLLSDMLWAEDEITRLDAEVKAKMAEHEALTKKADELRQQLVDCEETCGQEEPQEENSVGFYDPGFPAPESFLGVVAKCFECQSVADLLNAALVDRYILAGDIQSTASQLKHNSGVLTDLQTELTGLLAREQELLLPSTTSEDEAEMKAATEELNGIDARRRTVESDIAYFEDLNAKSQKSLDDMLTEHEALNQKIADLQAQLAECEKTCGSKDDDGGISMGGDATGAGGDNSPFASTDCQPCEVIVSQLNDAIGSVITTESELAEANDLLGELEAELAVKESAKKAAEDTFGAAMLEKSQFDADSTEAAAQQEIIDTNVELAGDLLSEIDEIELDLLNQRETVERLGRELSEWQQAVNTHRERLAVCEQQCADADDGSGVAIGEDGTEGEADGEDSPFASTDCRPCEVIVSQLNDAIGSVITTEGQLAGEQAKLEQLETDISAKEAAKKAAEDVFAAAMLEKSQFDADSAEAAVQQEIIDANVEIAGDLLSEIDEIELDLLNQRETVEALALQLSQWKQEVNTQRERLAVCEKQCETSDDEGAGVAVGGGETEGEDGDDDSPFATTDCQPCEIIVSQLNDAIGSVIATEGELTPAKARLEALEADLAAKEAAKTNAQNIFTAAMVEKSKFDADSAEAAAQQDIIDTNLDLASDLLSEIEEIELELLTQREKVSELEARLAGWRQEVNTQRTLLEVCEKQCAGDEEPPQVGMGEAPEGGEAVASGIPGQFNIGKSQPDACRQGQSCGFALSVTNNSDGSYSGPIFVSESMRVTAAGHDDSADNWQCVPASGGRSICLAEVSNVAPGQSLNLQVSAALPNQVAGGAQNCAAMALASDPRILTQMVQASLALRGYDVGGADGIAGPRTNAAVAVFAADSGLDFDGTDSAATYGALFGQAPPTTGESSSTCIALNVIRPEPVVTQSAPPPAPEPENNVQLDVPRPSFEIRIDQGGEHRDEREHQREQEGMPGMPGLTIEMPGFGGMGGISF